jgi:formate dehydrogenase subunit gamma
MSREGQVLESVTRSVETAVATHGERAGALLPILHAIQDELGYVPADAVAPLARALNLSRAEVHGVISFYHHFRTQPPGRHVLQLCRAEACQAMGADQIADAARTVLGIEFHETTPDGAVGLQPVFCLGNCACAPAAMFDGQVMGRLTVARVEQELARWLEKS